ncbi:type III secretion system inner membrane ring lipoprotein SctJ [Shewanella violacea]|uniref:Lipoprotein n=1 Tax=Shewanella violacea (strain JCM 10179 / CIP 106290 / LMG 19151 / DSS12) TaxID=637905 RepID=D4ZKL3_SHEVD|nr:type III secretion inner membrane ring lipoprotein SctJ [Shewanella violacea]BAJ02212.1 type III secretion system apparatus lipoprotein [Shewanella violacea DSS12]
MTYFKCTLLLLVILLSGCKVDLFRDLSQDDANQMVALLMLHHIDAASELDDKSGTITLKIDKDQFINAVELLRQNGFPKPHYSSIEDLFPSGQLVTSPTQEEAKMNYLKEQQLERTLSTMDGVISARVTIAEMELDPNRREPTDKSASVFIKYSPQANLSNAKNNIKKLIQNSVTGLSVDNISVYLQESNYRYQPITPSTSHTGNSGLLSAIETYKLPLVTGLLMIFLISMGGMWWMRGRYKT